MLQNFPEKIISIFEVYRILQSLQSFQVYRIFEKFIGISVNSLQKWKFSTTKSHKSKQKVNFIIEFGLLAIVILEEMNANTASIKYRFAIIGFSESPTRLLSTVLLNVRLSYIKQTTHE